jgi:transcriptional regulator with PAS, ATPase and Fis domain
VGEGTFRQDLFYRLNVLPIVLPPMRRLAEDVPLLAEHFLEDFGKNSTRRLEGISPEAMQYLERYQWPAGWNPEAAFLFHTPQRQPSPEMQGAAATH